MWRFFLTLFLGLYIYSSKAQVLLDNGPWANEPANLEKSIKLDNSILECIYHYSIIDNEVNNIREYDAIVEIGDSICKYECYQKFRLDSVLTILETVSNKEYFALSQKYSPSFSEYLIQNLNTRNLDYYGRISIDNFTYNEPIPDINWELKDSTKTICGYLCHQATCKFRGLKWTAWYCDIPKIVGPWKLNGLPGLILEAITEGKDHHFVATAIRKSNAPINYTEKDYFKTTRKHYNESLLDYKSNPGKTWKNTPLAPKDTNGKAMPIPKRKLFYNPLEKE